MVFDSLRSRVVLYGGTTGTLITSFKPDTIYEWDGTAWTLALPSAPAALAGRIYHGLCYDSARHVTLLFGGYSAAAPYTQDTWAYDGAAWTQLATTGPSPRNGAGLCFDSARAVAVLFGGYNGTTRFNDTWEWNGSAWTQRSPGAPADPPGRIYAPLAYDPLRARTVLFGGNGPSGYLGDTWEYDGAAGTWTQKSVPPPPAGPNARALCGFTYDSQRHAVMMHAGQQPGVTGNTDLWAWDGAAWTQITIALSPNARYNAPLVHDPARGNVLLFGGHIPYPITSPSTSNETWVLSCGTNPPPCYPNCDASTTPPVLNVADFTCFLQKFAAGDAYANCDGSTQAPVLNVADFTCFLQRFAAGCP
jgi:hypothetical protein